MTFLPASVMKTSRAIYVLAVTLQHAIFSNGFNCVKENSCRCRLDDGTVIDLSPIGLSSGTPKFQDLPDGGKGDLWSYNPCYSFTQKSCADAAACQSRGAESFITGTQESARFEYDQQNGLTLIYTHLGDITRTTYVYLICEPDIEGSLSAIGEILPDGNYYLYLSTKYACPRDASEDEDGGLSGGSILLIIVFVFITLYIAGGVVFMTKIRKAEGKDRIPNLTFWMSIPGYIKEGFVFTYNKIRTRAGYSSI